MPITSSCSSKQTFCNLSKQTVGKNSSITFNYSNCALNGENITAEHYNELINELIDIYNFGNRGTRNPKDLFDLSTSDLTGISTTGYESSPSPIISTNNNNLNNLLTTKQDYLSLNDYNKILNEINQNSKSLYYFAGKAFQEIVNQINNYSLQDDRCDNCNLNCNNQAQNDCNCDCDCDCGGNCDCDCGCCTTQQQYCCGYD